MSIGFYSIVDARRGVDVEYADAVHQWRLGQQKHEANGKIYGEIPCPVVTRH